MRDSNVVFISTGGEKYKVESPDRIGRQYINPHLPLSSSFGYPTGHDVREWNIDVIETLSNKSRYKNLMFVVGKWGTAFGEEDGVKTFIVASSIARIELL